MNIYIYLFLLIGACFGLMSFSSRHLFSEGPTKAQDAGRPASFSSRFFWLLVCTFLWPVLMLTGLNSAWILARRVKGSPSERRR